MRVPLKSIYFFLKIVVFSIRIESTSPQSKQKVNILFEPLIDILLGLMGIKSVPSTNSVPPHFRHFLFSIGKSPIVIEISFDQDDIHSILRILPNTLFVETLLVSLPFLVKS